MVKHMHVYERIPYGARIDSRFAGTHAKCTICHRKERLENLVPMSAGQ